MPCMKNEPSPAMTSRAPLCARSATPIAGAEAVSHAAHAQRDDESPVAAGRQMVDRRGADVSGIDDDVDTVGQRGIQHGHRLAVAHPGPVVRRRFNSVFGTDSGTRRRVGRPLPFNACVSSFSDPRRSSVWMWVHGTNGAADPIEYVGTDASASSRPARAVTDSRVPTSRHIALSAIAVGDPGMPHHAGHPERRRRSEPRCARDVLGIGDGGHAGAQHRAQLREFGARIVASDLLAGDDRDRAVGVPQRPRDRLRVTELTADRYR